MQIDKPIATALIFFTVLPVVFFLVKPQYKTFNDLRLELAKKRAEYNAEVDYYAAIAKIYNDLQGRQDDIKKVDNALPQDSELGKLVYYLQKTSSENGLIVKDVFLAKASQARQQAGNSNSVKDVSFTMDLLGNYAALGKFLAALEKSDRMFEVTNISFSSGSGALASRQATAKPQFSLTQTFSFNVQVKTHSY